MAQPKFDDMPDFPRDWEDEVIVSSLRENKDGTITIDARVTVYDAKHERVWTTVRRMRLERDD